MENCVAVYALCVKNGGIIMKLKDLKRGEYFTLKSFNGGEPSENQVYIRGEYDRAMRKLRKILNSLNRLNSRTIFSILLYQHQERKFYRNGLTNM